MAVLLAPDALQAKLPDWAEPVMAAAPDVPELSDHESNVLLSETRYEIQPDGKILARRRLAVQALRAMNQWEVGQQGYVHDSTAKVTSARAWHLIPGERAHRNWSPPVEVTVGDSFLSDTSASVIQVEN